MECMVFGDVMTKFYEDHCLRPGGTPGGQFTGRVLREIMSPKKLQALSRKLGRRGDLYIQYIESLRELYSHCVQKEMKDGFVQKAANFKNCFERVNSECGLPETVKVCLFNF